MRINKFIAKSGYTSRRKADDLIKNNKVLVNNSIMNEPGYDVKEDDIVEINGQILKIEEYFYYKLNKPVGYITSNYDPYNERDLNDLVKLDQKFFAAGRLDKDSHGLLIITNDGDFSNKLIHPSHKLSKEYIVKVNRELKSDEINKFKNGLDIGSGEITSKANIKLIDKNTYNVVIYQGFNRQIRRMFGVFGANVLDLKRIRIGEIYLEKLDQYQMEKFDKKEMEFVKRIKG